MKAWQVREWGEPEEMTLADAPIPEPGPGELRIANRAVGAEFFRHSADPGQVSVQAAVSFHAGRGSGGRGRRGRRGSNRLRAGRPGAGHAPGGRLRGIFTGARRRACSASRPEWISPKRRRCRSSITRPISRSTRGRRSKAGEWLLVHAGASGVGMAAIQIGKAMGARMIATAGSPEKLDFCRDAGRGPRHRLQRCGAGWTG